jgi:hypothetical protein
VSKKWWIIFVVALGLGCVAAILGIKLYGTDSFVENLLPGAGVSLIVFAIAILLIEGSVMTRENRLQKIVRKACRDVMQINEEIALTLVREIGEDLASRLDSNINLNGEERGNWADFKDLLRKVFKDARQVSVKGLPKSGSISKEDYLSFIGDVRKFMERVGSAIGNDWEVKAELLELIEHRDKLGKHIMEADYPYIIEDEKSRYEKLAVIGEAMIDLIDGCPRIKG